MSRQPALGLQLYASSLCPELTIAQSLLALVDISRRQATQEHCHPANDWGISYYEEILLHMPAHVRRLRYTIGGMC